MATSDTEEKLYLRLGLADYRTSKKPTTLLKLLLKSLLMDPGLILVLN